MQYQPWLYYHMSGSASQCGVVAVKNRTAVLIVFTIYYATYYELLYIAYPCNSLR